MKQYNNSGLKPLKIFEFNDVFVYIAIFLTITALFLFFLIPKKSPVNGFKVMIGDETILFYEYGKNAPTYYGNYDNNIDFSLENNSLKIYLNNDKSEYNVILFSNEKKEFKMIESTCSNTKECVKMPSVSSSGMIYCAPHLLKVLPITSFPSDLIVG